MKTYLVTGAAGFIGAAISKKLVEDGHKVVTIDNLSTGYRSNIPAGVKFYKGNCQNYEIVKQFENYSFEAIYHIAGQSSGEISFDDPVYDLQTNTQSTLLLLKLALKTGCKKFVYASTMSVYGDQPDEPIGEEIKPMPKSFYGVGKIASEHYLRIYQEYGINSVALRLFNVYGPGQNMLNLRQGMVSIFLAQAIKDKNILVKGSKDRFRDFVYIDDVVEAFVKSEENCKENFKVINIATQKKTTIEQLIENMKDILPFDVSVEFGGSTPGDQFGITAKIDNAKTLIAWQPKYDLKTGLTKMVNWALKNG
jgi:UDP-glucose 4-epimerase